MSVRGMGETDPMMRGGEKEENSRVEGLKGGYPHIRYVWNVGCPTDHANEKRGEFGREKKGVTSKEGKNTCWDGRTAPGRATIGPVFSNRGGKREGLRNRCSGENSQGGAVSQNRGPSFGRRRKEEGQPTVILTGGDRLI